MQHMPAVAWPLCVRTVVEMNARIFRAAQVCRMPRSYLRITY